jgi:hypothetical protein
MKTKNVTKVDRKDAEAKEQKKAAAAAVETEERKEVAKEPVKEVKAPKEISDAEKAEPHLRTGIIRGRMPLAVVYMVRFGDEAKGKKTKELALLFGTTEGKIDDLVNNRNFAYVTEDFRPTEEMKKQAVEYLEQHPNYDKGAVVGLLKELTHIPTATAEEAKAFEEKRVLARGQLPTTKTGEKADAGGGNRSKSAKKEKKAAEPKDELAEKGEKVTEGVTAEDLLK